MPPKKALYEQLLARQVKAHKCGTFYEACWFAHAIFEDRTRSIVQNSGDRTGYGKQINEKIELIEKRLEEKKNKLVNGKRKRNKKSGKYEKVPKWPYLHTLDPTLIADLKIWTKSRNDLVHKLASGAFSISEADNAIKNLSEEAIDLSKEICASARRVKGHQKKFATPKARTK